MDKHSTIETLTIYPDKERHIWMVRSDSPQTIESFGINTLPSAFTLNMPGVEVLAHIMALNPDKRVELQQRCSNDSKMTPSSTD